MNPAGNADLWIADNWVACPPEVELGAVGNRLTATLPSGKKSLLRRVVWEADGKRLPVWYLSARATELFAKSPAGRAWHIPATEQNYRERDANGGGGVTVTFYEQPASDLEPLATKLLGMGLADDTPAMHRVLASVCAALQDLGDCYSRDFAPVQTDGATVPLRPGIPVQSPVGIAVGGRDTVKLLDAGFALAHHDAAVDYLPGAFAEYFPYKQHVYGLRCEASHFDQLQALSILRLFQALMKELRTRGARAETVADMEATEARLKEAFDKSRRREGTSSLTELREVFANLEAIRVEFQQRAAQLDKDGRPRDFRKVANPPPPPLPEVPKKPERSKPEPETMGDEPQLLPEPRSLRTPMPVPAKGWPGSAKITAIVLGLLSLVLMLVLLLSPKRTTPEMPPEVASNSLPAVAAPGGQAVLEPTWYMIFPGQSVSAKVVEDAVRQALPGAKAEVIQADATKRAELLEARLRQNLGKITDPARLIAVLRKLGDKGTKVLGFDPDNKDTLVEVIRREGVYTYTAQSGQAVPGSLLQPTARDQLLKAGDFGSEPDAGKTLDELRTAVTDQTAYRELLNTLGERQAVVVLAPQSAADRAALAKLVGRETAPIFAARPPIVQFAAIDPRFERGQVTGGNELTVPADCHWRLVGEADRIKADLTGLTDDTRAQMRWQPYPRGKPIVWEGVELSQAGPVASFDIAIRVGDKVTVFRNQRVYSDRSRERVQKLLRAAAERLGMPANADSDALNIAASGSRFVGTLLYNNLATAPRDANRPDVKSLSAEEFEALIALENGGIKDPEPLKK